MVGCRGTRAAGLEKMKGWRASSVRRAIATRRVDRFASLHVAPGLANVL